MRLSFPHSLFRYEVGMLKVPAMYVYSSFRFRQTMCSFHAHARSRIICADIVTYRFWQKTEIDSAMMLAMIVPTNIMISTLKLPCCCYTCWRGAYLDAVALTGRARGNHTHQLASYFLVRSSTALRLLSGEYLPVFRTVWINYYVEDIYDDDDGSSSLSLFQSLTQTLCSYHYHQTSCPIPYTALTHHHHPVE